MFLSTVEKKMRCANINLDSYAHEVINKILSFLCLQHKKIQSQKKLLHSTPYQDVGSL